MHRLKITCHLVQLHIGILASKMLYDTLTCTEWFDIFRKTLLIMFDQTFCVMDNACAGTVVDIHVNFLTARILSRKAKHDFRPGPPELINGLVIIPDYADIGGSRIPCKHIKNIPL